MINSSQEQRPESQHSGEGENHNSQSQSSNDLETRNENIRAARTPSTYIQTVVTKILGRLRTDELKESFAKAMYMSVKLGKSNPVRACHPSQIQDETRLNPKIQKEYGIVLNKDSAIFFLEDFRGGEISASSFKKRHTRVSYAAKFNRRNPAVTGKKSMICTYAEWLVQEDFLFEPELPQELISLIPQDWKWSLEQLDTSETSSEG